MEGKEPVVLVLKTFSSDLWSQHGEQAGRAGILRGPHKFLYSITVLLQARVNFKLSSGKIKTKAEIQTVTGRSSLLGYFPQLALFVPKSPPLSFVSRSQGKAERTVTWLEWGCVPGSPLGSLLGPGFLVFQAEAPILFPFVLLLLMWLCPQPWGSPNLKLHSPVS